MKLLKTHMVLCILLWTVQASGFKSSSSRHFRRTQNHAENSHEELQSNTFTANSGNFAVPQEDQATYSSASYARRVLKGRRLETQTNSNTKPVRKQNIHHAGPSLPQLHLQSSPFHIPNGTNSINILASFAGKNRLLVISAPHESDSYYRLMMNLLKSDVYCEMADRHMQQIVMFHGKEGSGKVRRVSNQGSITEEPLDPAVVPKLMNFLKLEKGKFGMVLLKKTLQVEERYPYPVRLEAVYEVIDQTPKRKHEKIRQKGFVERCRAMGMEGKVIQPDEAVMTGSNPNGQLKTQETEKPEGEKSIPRSTQSTTTQSTTTTTTRATKKPTTLSASIINSATTAAKATTQQATNMTTAPTILPSSLFSTTTNPNTLFTKTAHRRTKMTPNRHKAPLITSKPTSQPVTRKRPKEHTVTNPFITSDVITQNRDKDKEQTDKILPGVHIQKPATEKTPKRRNKNEEKVRTTKQTEVYEAARPTANQPMSVNPTKAGKAKHDKAERKKKTERPEKSAKKKNTETKVSKASKSAEANRNAAKNASGHTEKDDLGKLTEKPKDSKKSLERFLSYFEKKRRLLVITAPSEKDNMYSQQKDEYLEQVCDMALRKISIVTIFGPLANGTMKIDHYQMEQDKPVRSLDSELINQELITAFRTELGIVSNDFYMVLTDFDAKVKQQYEVPITMKAVFDYIDTFSSRLREMELQRKLGITCKKEDKSKTLENFLYRFRWRRRLLIVSTPDDEEWTYQQQLHSLTNQACNLGLRHLSVLKLVGKTMEDMGGVLELYPINGTTKVEKEGLSASQVRDIRNYFQVSADYFSMLLVGKDGNVKSWYPSPMWSMSTIYELIDSMQLRRQEMAIQLSLGMHCPEVDYGHHEDYHHSYGY